MELCLNALVLLSQRLLAAFHGTILLHDMLALLQVFKHRIGLVAKLRTALSPDFA